MLINRIRNSYRDLIRHVEPVQALVTVADIQPAANANDYDQSEVQTRRLRRQRRQEKAGQHSGLGWSVRTW
ncbi:MAG: hypothetical protein GY732_12160 [Gammaproteobacteria bacterium]|nr:hypothetical protein [Gammaproteobacteria bacterium]